MTGLRHYGSPADMLRQLSALDVVAVLRRANGALHLGYSAVADQAASALVVLDAFESGEDWQTSCVCTVSALAGANPLQISAGATVEVDLRRAFANAELLPAWMLERGLLQ